ncbi:hypothetical protein HY989_05420 [Candidatus Micrarchaeota archaeon]|nr:hypothetical protein [Candidatus Micrarchaeota archaeon]
MTICARCEKPFLDCCEDRTLCADCIKKKVREKVAAASNLKVQPKQMHPKQTQPKQMHPNK